MTANPTETASYGDWDTRELIHGMSQLHITKISDEIVRQGEGCRFLEIGVGGSSLCWGAWLSMTGGELHLIDGDDGWMARVHKDLCEQGTPCFAHRAIQLDHIADVIDADRDGLEWVPFNIVVIDQDPGWDLRQPSRLECLKRAWRWITPDGSVFLHDSQNTRYRNAKRSYTTVWEGPDPRYKESPAAQLPQPLKASTALWHGKRT